MILSSDSTREVGLVEDLETARRSLGTGSNAAQDHKQEMGRNEGRVLVDRSKSIWVDPNCGLLG